MQVKITTKNRKTSLRVSGYTLVEVVMSVAISALVIGTILYGYNVSTRQLTYASSSVAAQAAAMERYEQTVGALWRPAVVLDQLITSNFPPVRAADGVLYNTATNYTTITSLSINPPLRMVRVDCVWVYGGVLYTNTVAGLRAPDP